MFTFSPPTLIGIGLLVVGLYLALYFAYAELSGKLDRLLEDGEHLQEKMAEIDRKVDEVPTYHWVRDNREPRVARSSVGVDRRP